MAQVTLLSKEYDEMSRVSRNKLHGLATLAVDYTYNLRSYLTSISGCGFTQNLYYIDGPGEVYYNGNISSMKWKGNDGITRGYKFSYDNLNRMTNATYGEGTSINTNPDRFTEQVTAYDKNGNIQGLKRYGQTGASSYGLIDNLTVTTNGNQLKAVHDAATASAYNNGFEFKNGANTTTEYTYDANGNLAKDLNKGIEEIHYNFLNLPSLVKFTDGSTITYTYGADGTKLRTVHKTGSVTTTTDYCGNVIYENNTAKLLLTEEGYVSLSDKKYHYYLKDHQGNNRVVVDKDGNVEETNHYYPFGGVFASSQNVQPYKYNDKELDTQKGLNWYDYGARMYDAALGRFTAIDLLAEKYFSISPYTYCANNPANAIDSDGKKIIFVNGYWNSTFIGKEIIKSTSPGKPYWGNGFSEAAQRFFNDYSVITDDNYVDGSSFMGIGQGARVRYSSGYKYAERNYNKLIAGMKKGETFKFVTHSEGSAFGAGMISFLIKKGHVVETVIHLSAYQADSFFTPEGPNTYQLGYEGDWITGNKEIEGVDRFGIVDKFKTFSDRYSFSHGSTKNARVFRDVQALLDAIVQTGASYNVTETKNGTRFTIINRY